MKLLKRTKSKITKNGTGQNCLYLQITEVLSIHCNVVNNCYQKKSKTLYTFVPNKSFSKLLDIFLKYFISLKIFDSVFSYIEVWFTDQNCNPYFVEGKINITLVIN